jgi:putative nucleotidyltransferase with HDIG domain
MKELRQTYRGLLLILRQFITKDKHADNHSYRVSLYATRIAAYLGFNAQRMETLRAAALLHDIGKLEINRQLIYKAACLSHEEYEDVRKHLEKGHEVFVPVVGPLSRIIPIILAQHGEAAPSETGSAATSHIPVEARIISVADTYDSLTSDQPHRKAISPLDARETIVRGSGSEFDPMVVDAFRKAFRRGDLEVPELVL